MFHSPCMGFTHRLHGLGKIPEGFGGVNVHDLFRLKALGFSVVHVYIARPHIKRRHVWLGFGVFGHLDNMGNARFRRGQCPGAKCWKNDHVALLFHSSGDLGVEPDICGRRASLGITSMVMEDGRSLPPALQGLVGNFLRAVGHVRIVLP